MTQRWNGGRDSYRPAGEPIDPSRRTLLTAGTATGAAALLPDLPAWAQAPALMARKIPASGELLPVIGIGTAIIFDFENDKAKLAERAEVLKVLVAGGGKLVDTAPSYGKAEQTLGELFALTGLRSKLFLAGKVRVNDAAGTAAEMKASFAKMKVDKVDLMQLHNVRDANQSLAQLRDWKKQGLCRYFGITSSFDRDYAAVEACLKKEKPEFFQIDYSMVDRNSEDRLIPAAAGAYQAWIGWQMFNGTPTPAAKNAAIAGIVGSLFGMNILSAAGSVFALMQVGNDDVKGWLEQHGAV